MKPNHSSLEPAIRRIGQDLAERSAGLAPTVFDPRWWSGNLLDWCMKDETFKVRLFRFIDVLPSLRDDAQVARLVEEYFGEGETLAPTLQWGLRAMSVTRLGARLSAKSLRRQIHQMAQTFIAGASIDSAVPALSRLWKEGRGFSVDLLGEATVSEKEADQYRDRCLEALRFLGKAASAWPSVPVLEQDRFGPLPRVHLSVKLSALYSQLDPIDPESSFRAVAARLRPMLDLATVIPAAITFDMEQAELKDLTLMIFMRLLSEDAYRRYPHGGIAMQAYLKESAADVNNVIRWVRQRGVPVTIRLVKGAYWDSDAIRYQQRGWPVPLFETKAETDANYEALSRTLVEHADLLQPAFGTHNLRSLAHALAASEAAGLPPEACEYQMIFGMAEPLQAAVAQAGKRVRIYTPVGELLPGMAYLVRRLLENTSNESFLRKEYAELESLDHLLAPPRAPTHPTPGHPVDRPSDPGLTDRFHNEPHTDFSNASARAAMAKAITTVRAQLGRTLVSTARPGLSPSGPELVSRNPSSPSEVVGRLRGFAPDDVSIAARQALSKLPGWSATPPAQRADILTKAAAAMRQRRVDLAAWEIFETGKPWHEADADVAEAIDFLEFYAREMRRLSSPRRLGHEPGELNLLVLSPRGLVAVISPWNFPLAIPTGMVSAALVTGNAVLFKPSERSPVMGHLLVELLEEAGVPDGVLQFMPGGPDIGQSLVAHPDVQVIAFTGSKDVGLRILAQAGRVEPGQRSVKRVITEMGGKNAIIVDDTADLDEAVVGVVTSFTGYQGQKCSACSRAIVHESISDVFLQRLAEAVMSLRIGPPEDPGNRMGPLIDERARANVRGYIEIGKREGRLVLERQVTGDGFFLGPAVFADIQPSHRLAQEEIFGPVLAVMRARDFTEAIRLANATSYALTGGVYSRSPANILTARETFDVGNLYINRPITGALVGRQPFGGHRLSGVGAKAGSEGYLAQFMVTRVVSENTLRRGFAPSE
jgi:RHH-type proline utilization regulon transcriptional repressor/proline dehydrogenase/delta 1-pyrroline-5-carboxylate dehydrogenase